MINQTLAEQAHVFSEENDLDLLATISTSMHSFFSASGSRTSVHYMHPSTISLKPRSENYTEDSKLCNLWANTWEEENGRAHTLEMLGCALLEAAITLQRQSSTFQNQKTNPALPFAIKFLLMSIAHMDNPTEEQRELSSNYAELLRPFTQYTLFEQSEEYYLEHLRIRIGNDTKTPNIHKLNVCDMVELLFKTLSARCAPEDYALVKTSFFQSLEETTKLLP